MVDLVRCRLVVPVQKAQHRPAARHRRLPGREREQVAQRRRFDQVRLFSVHVSR
jgi:hypothetical protein